MKILYYIERFGEKTKKIPNLNEYGIIITIFPNFNDYDNYNVQNYLNFHPVFTVNQYKNIFGLYYQSITVEST
jgi:hypothetical protein